METSSSVPKTELGPAFLSDLQQTLEGLVRAGRLDLIEIIDGCLVEWQVPPADKLGQFVTVVQVDGMDHHLKFNLPADITKEGKTSSEPGERYIDMIYKPPNGATYI